MKVILQQDVRGIGKKHEMRDVPTGHAQNFLIPRKLAIPATDENIRKLKADEQKRRDAKASDDHMFTAALLKLASKAVTVSLPANEQGHLYEGIGPDALKTRLALQGIDIGTGEIVLAHPIKTVGEHEVVVRHGDVTGTFTLIIVSNA